MAICWVSALIATDYRTLEVTRKAERLAAFDKDPLPRCADAVLIGSSSIRRWRIEAAFPDRKIVNRGVDSATISDISDALPRLFSRVRAKAVFLYVGENDVARGRTPEIVTADILSLIRQIHHRLPKASIYYLSIKPTSHRWNDWPASKQANALIKSNKLAFNFTYIELGQRLTPEDTSPNPLLFREDGIHMSDAGYRVWSSAIAPVMRRLANRPATTCQLDPT